MVWATGQDDFKNDFPLHRQIRKVVNNPDLRPIIWDEISDNPLTPFIIEESDDLDILVGDIVLDRVRERSPITRLELPKSDDLDDYFNHVSLPQSDVDSIRGDWLEIEQKVGQYDRNNSNASDPLEELQGQVEDLIDSVESQIQDDDDDSWKYVPLYQLLFLLYIMLLLEEIIVDFFSDSTSDPNPDDGDREKCQGQVNEAADKIDNFADKLEDFLKRWPDKDLGPIDYVLYGDESKESPKPKPPSNDKYNYAVKVNFAIREENEEPWGRREYIAMTLEFFTFDKKQKLAQYTATYYGPTDIGNIAFWLGFWGHAEFNYDIQWLISERWAAQLLVFKAEDYWNDVAEEIFLARKGITVDLNPEITPKLPLDLIAMEFTGRSQEDIGNVALPFDKQFRENIIRVLPSRSDTRNRYRRFSNRNF